MAFVSFLDKFVSKGRQAQIYEAGAISAEPALWIHGTLFFKTVATQNTIQEVFWETDIDFILSKVFSMEIGCRV